MLAAAIAGALRAQMLTARLANAWADLFEGLALTALDAEEQASLTRRIYDRAPGHRRAELDLALASWLKGALPPAPARVLLGGCGAGREALWLVEQGYEVDAFDPAPALVAVARRRLRGRAQVLHGSYAELVDGRLYEPGRGFDAIVLGWGSFSHVLGEGARLALLRACARLCPAGPTLVSWLPGAAEPDGPGPEGPGLPPGRTRMAHLGTRLGRSLAALRGIAAEEIGRAEPGDVLLPHGGIAHLFVEGEVEALAARAGFRFEPVAGAPPRATLRPRRPPPRPRRPRRPREDVGHGARPSIEVDLLADVLARGHTPVIVARGTSMTAAIPHGARLTLAPLAEPALRGVSLGDVVAARVHGRLVVHRVVGIDARGQLLLKGDACPTADGWIGREALLGQVVAIDDGKGPRPVPAATPRRAWWRRGFGRIERAVTALSGD
jgi:hypothetical protein